MLQRQQKANSASYKTKVEDEKCAVKQVTARTHMGRKYREGGSMRHQEEWVPENDP